MKNPHIQTGVETRGRAHKKMGTGTGAGMETGTRTGARTGSGRAAERRRSARIPRGVVDAVWETGGTWVGIKNADKKGLVQ